MQRSCLAKSAVGVGQGVGGGRFSLKDAARGSGNGMSGSEVLERDSYC